MQSLRANPSSPRLLVVDDQPFILDVIRRYFTLLGYEVDTATEREEAEALLEHRHYGAVIADLGLGRFSDVDGLDIVTFARYRSPSIKVVVLTGFDGEALRQESHRRGADVFLTKPQPLPTLAGVIADLLAA